jgi:hypothetical protein
MPLESGLGRSKQLEKPVAMAPDCDSLQSGLVGDVAWALSLQPCSAITRRAAVRSILAAIEGIIGILHRGLLSMATLELSGPERAFLRHDTGVHAGNGGGNTAHELPLRRRVELTAALLERLRPDFRLDFGVAGWRELLSSLDIADRLKYAQDLTDLEVSEAQLASAVLGYTWLLDNVVAAAQCGFQERGEDALNSQSTSQGTLLRAPGDSVDL